MTTATLSRGNRSVSFDVIGEGGEPLVARNFGKPNLGVNANSGGLDPLMQQDVRSAQETININTQLFSYDKAATLADIIKSHSRGTPITLDIPLAEYDDSIKTHPALEQEEALTLTYEPGRGERVGVSLSLSRIGTLNATDSGGVAETPRATGDGPVTVGSGTDTVPFDTDLTVERAVGRPNVRITPEYQDYPDIVDQRKAAYDAFSLTVSSMSAAVAKTTTLRNLFRKRRGRNAMPLDFTGRYGLGQFEVIPSGNQALRHVRSAGREGSRDMSVPAVSLRVVRDG